MQNLVAVVVNLPKQSEKQILYYKFPEKMVDILKIGCRVLVPVGNALREGYVVDFPETSEIKKLKEIAQILEDKPLIPEELMKLALWISKSYLSPIHKVIEQIIPPAMRIEPDRWVRLLENNELSISLSVLDVRVANILSSLENGPVKLNSLLRKYGGDINSSLQDLKQRGLIEIFLDFKTKETNSSVTIIEKIVKKEEYDNVLKELKRAPIQLKILNILDTVGQIEQQKLLKEYSLNLSSINALEKKGYIRKHKLKKERTPELNEEFLNHKKLTLNDSQQNAVSLITKAINENQLETFLLHGVTGSGKTEVYLRSIINAVNQGKGALLLVPEISLTHQTIGRFKGVLGQQVVVLHSGLSEGERLDAWNALRSGNAKVAIGVRSAVFAPVQNLGIIIIDEEHESTYKQTEPDPRYHTRDVAIERIRNLNGVLILGSATPSIETYYNAKQNNYTLIELAQRVKANPLPKVEVVDLKNELESGNKSIFSRVLHQSISDTLAKGEQVILFMNRRGYSTFVLCRECGESLMCKNCSISLTYHFVNSEMRCHYCNYRASVPTKCPHCGSKYIRYFGSGTQQVEVELIKAFPGIKVTRMDVDTTTRKNSHQELLAEFSKGETQVLLGTQMIAKGLDFPNVTLVGVIAADTSLNLPDFRAGEKTFQLITQVAGRTGRGDKIGKVIVQTYNPEHYAIIHAKNHDYKSFYEKEIEQRQIIGYPPFNSLVRIIINGHEEDIVMNLAEKIGLDLKNISKDKIEIFGPAPAPLAKIQNRFRWQIILKANSLDFLRKVAWHEYKKYVNLKEYNQLRIIIDIEPQSIL
ncbi:replication restart DNA helicase PriA [Desulfonispora thiosulfatigenes DSM 11270]|uniref:Replication restart protein PriA n=1 Tax=Desulfonispora thiosulfatigenes DSM 11270 TaxID=656914 RepID=A0A1W1VKB4_DESTI|nr:primosomal protein N' [Desulfonispora thiosulfatigenes]SMB93384.1 replication restart DNA helicase PriA [Desulfonispora thiosulfatigenes DSM 11270]